MDKVILVDNNINAGISLITRLDNAEFPVYSAFWYLDMSSSTWKLIIGSPRINSVGPLEAYGQIFQHVIDMNPNDLSIKDIVILSPDNTLIALLSSVFHTERTQINGLRITNNTINNFFVTDAYIYRLS